MADNSLQMNSNSYAKTQGLRGSCPLLIIHHRTIMEAARAMLHDQDLPMHLWAKAAKTIVYVQNHTPHKSTQEQDS